jgi:ribose transport system permease protein
MSASTRHFRPVLILVVALLVVFSVTQDGFLDAQNLKNLLTAVSVIWVVAICATFITIVGGFDLSVGALATLTGIFLVKVIGLGVPGGAAIVLAVLFGAAVGGLVNGLLIGRLGLSFFVVTLASMTAFTGVVNLWSETETVSITSPAILGIATDELLGVPIAIWIMAAVFLVALVIQERTFFGRDIYAVGGSIVAARLSGIRTERTVVAVYAIVGAAAALAGVIASSRIGAASPVVSPDLALQAAAAVLLGGTALTGGAGGVGGTALGVLFIGILQNGLSLAGIQSYWQQVVTGLILVVAVLGDRVTLAAVLRRRAREAAR